MSLLFPVDQPYAIMTDYSDGHPGWDIAPRPAGTKVPIRASEDGRVINVGTTASNPVGGNFVILYGNGTGKYYYHGHLDSYQVRAGQTISRGQQVAVMGKTGPVSGPSRVTGVHDHHEVRYQAGPGRTVDPRKHYEVKGDDEVKIEDKDNWFHRFNKLSVQTVNKELTREEFRQHFVGQEAWRMVEVLSDREEAATASSVQEIGNIAIREKWPEQIAELRKKLAAAQGGSAEAKYELVGEVLGTKVYKEKEN